MKKIALVIPARYNSSRLPGKPLIKIAGKAMLERVYTIANNVAVNYSNNIEINTTISIKIVVATEDIRIVDFCSHLNIPVVLTSEYCETGSDRCLEAVEKLKLLGFDADFVINLQGDNPLCPPWFLSEMIAIMLADTDNKYDVFTPCEALTYEQLNVLRDNKKTTPFSGTTVTFLPQNHSINPYKALWFSKNIIPALRQEPQQHTHDTLKNFSGVWRHIGLYGYRYDALKSFCDTPLGLYEQSEGLEQLRFIEAGVAIRMIPVTYRGFPGVSGVDSLEDVRRYEDVFEKHGDILNRVDDKINA